MAIRKDHCFVAVSPVLYWMQHPPLFSHGLWVGDSGAEEPVHLQPAVESGPLVVPGRGVGQAPRDDGVALLVLGVALLALAGGAVAHAAEGAVTGLATDVVIVPRGKAVKVKIFP